jgi:hypothetical protein
MISSEKTYGFRGDMFPILACVIGMSSIAISYFIALHYEHIDPFPKTDITHCGIQFPEYIPFRIGLMAIIPLFIISWNLAKYPCRYPQKLPADPELPVQAAIRPPAEQHGVNRVNRLLRARPLHSHNLRWQEPRRHKRHELDIAHPRRHDVLRCDPHQLSEDEQGVQVAVAVWQVL